ncbi:7914_t:CDS:2, partial [Entrophospora sp. SA101]
LRPEIPSHMPKLLTKLIMECWDAQPDKRPTSKKLFTIINKWDMNSNSLFAGFITPKLPFWKLHSEAIYTSRLLDTSNLPPPVNTPDFEKQLSKLVSEVLDDKQNILDMHDSKQVELTIPGGKQYII